MAKAGMKHPGSKDNHGKSGQEMNKPKNEQKPVPEIKGKKKK